MEKKGVVPSMKGRMKVRDTCIHANDNTQRNTLSQTLKLAGISYALLAPSHVQASKHNHNPQLYFILFLVHTLYYENDSTDMMMSK